LDVDEIVMALQSKLFGGDPRLEAAATSDAAHITQGAVGEFVRKIQTALQQLDNATIDADGRYGPATAAAVLACKRKRDIVNRSYQSQADNVVGKMTMATLDAEMVEAEKRVKIEFDSSFCSFTPRPGPKFS
jgi:peptidoglycan hydrolase-like protein with peptidoglycan-binding domain